MKTSTPRLAALIFVIALMLPVSAYAQKLSVSIGDRSENFSAQDLLGNPATVTIDVPNDIAYKKPMQYRALPLSRLLEDFPLPDDKDLQTMASDGFAATLPRHLVLRTADDKRAVPYLAIEPVDTPWPPLSKDKPATAGPFYIVWLHPEADSISPEQWPYSVVKIADADAPAKRWPQIAVDKSLAENDPLRKGQSLFITNCMACHKMNGAGASDLGPDLNLPQNATEYFQRKALTTYIRNPASVREWKDMTMPGFDEDALSDGDIELIVSYLEHMASRKAAAEK